MYRIILLTVIAICALACSAFAAVPQLINYQGFLRDDVPPKNPVNGTFDIKFTIYDDSTAGNIIWTETQIGVVVDVGIFRALLGSVTTLVDTMFNDTTRYLGVIVGTDPEITPRSRFVTTPYSFNSVISDTSQHALTIADNSVTDTKIVDGSISFADIGTNAATTGQVMKWDVNSWVASDDETGVNVSDTIVTITLFPFQNLFRFYTQVDGNADVNLFTVPAGKTLYITSVWIASDLNGGSDGAVYIVGSNTLLFFQTTYSYFPLYSWSSGGGAPFEVLAGQTVNLDKNGSTTFVNVTITGFLF